MKGPLENTQLFEIRHEIARHVSDQAKNSILYVPNILFLLSKSRLVFRYCLEMTSFEELAFQNNRHADVRSDCRGSIRGSERNGTRRIARLFGFTAYRPGYRQEVKIVLI